MNRGCRLCCLIIAGSLLCLGVFAQSPDKIEISKMNPAGLLVDKYSYMAQPYNFYYFHNMDRLGLRTDWIKKGTNVYPLREPVSPLLEEEQGLVFQKIAAEIVP